MQLGFFYLLVLVGFGLLYFTWKSNARQALACGSSVAGLLRAQRSAVRSLEGRPQRARGRVRARRLKEWKEQFERAVANQRGRAFEPQDAAKLYGM